MSQKLRQKILVVEPDPGLRHELAEACRDEPYDLLLSADPEQARGLLEVSPPDLVVVDSALGPAVLAALEATPGGKGMPLLMTLAAPDPEEDTVLKAFEEGADDLLCRPFGAAWLRTRFRVWLSRSLRFERSTKPS